MPLADIYLEKKLVGMSVVYISIRKLEVGKIWSGTRLLKRGQALGLVGLITTDVSWEKSLGSPVSESVQSGLE